MSSSDDIGFFPQPSPTPTKSANATLICHICQSPHYNTEFFYIFSISVCTKCKKSIKMITKSTCLNEYLLTDYDLKPFKFLIRPNPHKGTWSNMNLYIESEIVKCALEKHGSIENIEKIKNDRIEANLERKKKRMKKKVKDYKRKTLVTMKSERHTHNFVTIGSVKKCDCGLEYEEEEI